MLALIEQPSGRGRKGGKAIESVGASETKVPVKAVRASGSIRGGAGLPWLFRRRSELLSPQ